jgi:hypothetical protein
MPIAETDNRIASHFRPRDGRFIHQSGDLFTIFADFLVGNIVQKICDAPVRFLRFQFSHKFYFNASSASSIVAFPQSGFRFQTLYIPN